MFNIENRKKKVFWNGRVEKSLVALLAFFSVLAFSFFSAAVIAPSSNSTTYNSTFDVLSAGGTSNTTYFNASVEISPVGGKTNSTNFNNTYGLLASLNEYPTGTTIIPTTTTSSEGSSTSTATATATVVSNNTSTASIIGLVLSGGEIGIIIPEGVVFERINVTLNSSVASPKIEVVKLAEKPAIVPEAPTGAVYSFLEVKLTRLSDDKISAAKLRFKVTQQWITDNGIDKSKVFLQRWNGKSWDTLSTNKLSETASDVVYEATSTGLSYFAVVGFKPDEVPPTTLPPVTTSTTTTLSIIQIPTGGEPITVPTYFVVLAILAILIGGYWFFVIKKGKLK